MNAPQRMILATRRSALALAQSRAFAVALTHGRPDIVVDELHVVTTGDRITDVALAEVGGKGLFIKEIEQALLDHRADFAVHSLKDVPALIAPELCLACIPERADARDVLARPQGQPLSSLADLPRGARIGTSSLRRSVQLLRARPDLMLVPLRGNVDTRLRKLDAGEMDGIVIARAGLVRLGLGAREVEVLDPETIIPAPGQGAIAVQCRSNDHVTRTLLAALEDAETSVAVACERGAMSSLGADCKVPFGAYARREGTHLSVVAFYASGDRFGMFKRVERTCPWPRSVDLATTIGLELGRELLES